MTFPPCDKSHDTFLEKNGFSCECVFKFWMRYNLSSDYIASKMWQNLSSDFGSVFKENCFIQSVNHVVWIKFNLSQLAEKLPL